MALTNILTHTAARNPALNPTQVPLEWVQKALRGECVRIAAPAAGVVLKCTETKLVVAWDDPMWKPMSYDIFGQGEGTVAILMPHHDDAPAPKRARRPSAKSGGPS